MAAIVIGAIIAAKISYRLIELPSNRLGHMLTKRNKPSLKVAQAGLNWPAGFVFSVITSTKYEAGKNFVNARTFLEIKRLWGSAFRIGAYKAP